MVRRSIIVTLLIAGLSICFLLVLSFSHDPAESRRSIDLRNRTVMAWVHRGSLTIASGSLPEYHVYPDGTLPIEDVLFIAETDRSFRMYRKVEIQNRVLSQSAFNEGCNATRFGFASSIQVPVVSKRRTTKNSKKFNRLSCIPVVVSILPVYRPTQHMLSSMDRCAAIFVAREISVSTAVTT
jgi:hypothetical protein